MRRRRGITLIQVLVAIFIMAIGLLAILTLFPLGVLRMAERAQNDRDAASASAGANTCDAFNLDDNDLNHDYPNPTAPTAPVNYYLARDFRRLGTFHRSSRTDRATRCTSILGGAASNGSPSLSVGASRGSCHRPFPCRTVRGSRITF